jgi:hypothetical protein
MVRAKIWFRCAAVHDPICPMVVQPALIGWEAKYRDIDLVIERAFKGDELVRRMKGWITIDPYRVIEMINKHGRLKVLDDRELVVEIGSIEEFNELQEALDNVFGDQLELELIEKK